MPENYKRLFQKSGVTFRFYKEKSNAEEGVRAGPVSRPSAESTKSLAPSGDFCYTKRRNRAKARRYAVKTRYQTLFPATLIFSAGLMILGLCLEAPADILQGLWHIVGWTRYLASCCLGSEDLSLALSHNHCRQFVRILLQHLLCVWGWIQVNHHLKDLSLPT